MQGDVPFKLVGAAARAVVLMERPIAKQAAGIVLAEQTKPITDQANGLPREVRMIGGDGLKTTRAKCPLMAISGLFSVGPGTSAFPPKADIRIAIPYQPLTNVCFAPNSGRSTGCREISASDPKRTFAALN